MSNQQIDVMRFGGRCDWHGSIKPCQQCAAEVAGERPRCATRGMLRPGAMCGSVIVGGEFCGSKKECQHKLLPNTEAQRAAVGGPTGAQS